MNPAQVLCTVCLALLAAGSGLLACTYLDLRAQSLTRAMQGQALRRAGFHALASIVLTGAAFALALA